MLLPLSGKFVFFFTCIHFQCAINPSNIPGLEHFKQELISRLDSRTLPFERRHRWCKQRAKHLSAERCACKPLASCLLTNHTSDDVIVTHALQKMIDQ